MLQESRGKRPFKLWDGRRSVRKGLVVGSLEELVQRGREKLGVSVGEPVRLVLESDGTQVEDAEYFRTLPANTVLLLLRPGERWLPAGVDVIRAGRYSLWCRGRSCGVLQVSLKCCQEAGVCQRRPLCTGARRQIRDQPCTF